MKDQLNEAIRNCKDFDQVMKLCEWITENRDKTYGMHVHATKKETLRN